MEKLVKKRKALMARLTGIRSRVSAMDASKVRSDDLTAEIECLKDFNLDFRRIQEDIVGLCEDDEQLDEAIKIGTKVDQEHNSVRAMLTQFLRVVQNRENPPPLVTSGAQSQVVDNRDANRDAIAPPVGLPELNLPKGMLPTFSGDYGEWTSFFDLFTSSVHNNPRLTDAQRLLYLKTYTSGPAAAILRHVKVEDRAYQGALEALQKRFDRKDQIVSHQIQRYLDIPTSSVSSASNLRRAFSTADDVVRALKASNREERDCWLIHLLLSKLDPETRQLWANKTSTNDAAAAPSTINDFLEFLDQRAYTLESAHRPSSHVSNKVPPKASSTRQSSSFIATNESSASNCPVCNERSHLLYTCKKFQNLQPPERLQLTYQHGLCLNCLREGHGKNSCTSIKCRKCNQLHHTLLHDSFRHSYERSQQPPVRTVSNLSYNNAYTSVFLATAVVNIIDARGKPQPARALLDSASQACFITGALKTRLGLRTEQINLPLQGISGLSTRITEAATINLQSRNSDYSQQLQCAVLYKISDPIPQKHVDISDWDLPPSVQLADTGFNIPSNVDLLIGAGIFYDLLGNQRISLGKMRPVLQSTHLGWVVAGIYDNETPPEKLASTALCFTSYVQREESTQLNDLVAKFWELEELPPTKHLTEEERLCEEHYQQHTTRDASGRYIVKLPFRKDPAVIGETAYSALHQFNAVSRKLAKNPKLSELYFDYINEFIEAGYISKAEPANPSERTIYLPHHGVLKEQSTTTKLRVVFNASLKSTNGISLNDLLMVGPVVQESLYSILLNFRTPRIAITGDIERMYLQIYVSDEDKHRTRMLWQERDHRLAEYTLNTVTFGMACAPFLATRTLKQLARDDGHLFPLAEKAIDDFYVDDCLTGASTVDEAIEKRRQITELLKRGGFSIRKWATNDPTVLNDIHPSDRAISLTQELDPGASLKTLGVRWHFGEDMFTFSACCNQQKDISSKRDVLSTIAKIFDPLGLIGPVIVTAKAFMQELWQLQVDWADPLPDSMKTRWQNYLRDLDDVQQIKIPRRCIGVEHPTRVLLHGYCDASNTAYGAVLYLRTIDEAGNTSSRLLCSKSKVAPINKPTIPRLELCGAVLLARLIDTVKAALRIPINQTVAWSDSTTTLAWIAGNPSRWKTFVSNRVAEINTILPAVNWRHIPGPDNPADMLSRGLPPKDLASSQLWWEGPRWNDTPNSASKIELTATEAAIVDKERRKQAPVQTFIVIVNETVDQLIQRHSSFTRLVRTTAWVARFIRNCQRTVEARQLGPLSVDEQESAKARLIRYTQQLEYPAEIQALEKQKELPRSSKLLPLSPFLDGGLLRVGGRLARSELPYETKHPLILPPTSRLAELIFRHEHLRNHHLGAQSLLATVRRTYWIPHGRNLARNTVWKCVPCFKFNPNRGLLQQIMGQLPPQRLEQVPAFYISGVDYGGPITLVQRRGPGAPTTKGYIAIFVCFVTRAVHIEAVSKLSTKAFLAALQRFVARRGHCGHLYSDNGTNFVGAAKEMQQWYRTIRTSNHNNTVADMLSKGGTQWHFIPPGSPHLGGLWEAAIKSAKHHLNIVTRNVRLTFEEFSTLLTEIEAVLNSRPISPASNDPNDVQPLTPGHFLVGRPLTAPNQQDIDPSPDESYDVRFKYIHELRQHFWDRWSREFVPELQTKGKWHRPTTELKVGDMVLLRHQRLPPAQWAMGRVIELKPSADGNPRLVNLKVKDGELLQSIHNLHKLPLDVEN